MTKPLILAEYPKVIVYQLTFKFGTNPNFQTTYNESHFQIQYNMQHVSKKQYIKTADLHVSRSEQNNVTDVPKLNQVTGAKADSTVTDNNTALTSDISLFDLIGKDMSDTSEVTPQFCVTFGDTSFLNRTVRVFYFFVRRRAFIIWIWLLSFFRF